MLHHGKQFRLICAAEWVVGVIAVGVLACGGGSDGIAAPSTRIPPPIDCRPIGIGGAPPSLPSSPNPEPSCLR